MNRRGFTLVEVMVALAVMGVLLLGLRGIMGQVADSADRITAAAKDGDRESNGWWLLRSLLEGVDVSPHSGRERVFAGGPRLMGFHTWCEVPDGWLERCEAVLGFSEMGAEPVLLLGLPSQHPIVLRRGFHRGGFVYLVAPEHGGVWAQNWNADFALPRAVGVIIDSDTLIIRTGDRG